MTAEDAIKKFLDSVRSDIILQMDERNMIASGGTIASLKVELADGTPVTGKLTGNPSIYYLIHGRKPGNMPPVQRLFDWVRARGLDISPWAVAKSIAKKGTTIFQGRRKGLEIPPIMEKHMTELMENLKDSIMNNMISKMLKDSIAKQRGK